MFFMGVQAVILMMVMFDHGMMAAIGDNCTVDMPSDTKNLIGKAFLLPVMSNASLNPKRAMTKPPWTCASKYIWEDLGNDYYPRYVRTVRCLNAVCLSGVYRCKEQRYALQILHRKSPQGQDCNGVDAANAIPGELRKIWEIVEHSVTIWCDCSI